MIMEGNRARFGGGIRNEAGDLTINNSTIGPNNVSTSDGGGVHNSTSGDLTINESVIYGNSSNGLSGGGESFRTGREPGTRPPIVSK
jgi:hypothetical protein